MYKTISKRVVTLLISRQAVKSDEREIYEYSFEVLLSTFTSVLCILSIAVLVRKVLLSLLFMSGFVVSRFCCGGYHAKHHLTCLLTTVVNYLAFLAVLSFAQQYIKLAVLIMAGISALLIFLFAPAEHVYNPLSETERKRHRLRSIVLVVIYVTLSVILMYKNVLAAEVFSVGFGVFSVAFSLLLAKIEKRQGEYVNS
jgi:accessory gene regulator B